MKTGTMLSYTTENIYKGLILLTYHQNNLMIKMAFCVLET